MFSKDFLNKMNALLGEEEFDAFLAAEEREAVHALRLNPRKLCAGAVISPNAAADSLDSGAVSSGSNAASSDSAAPSSGSNAASSDSAAPSSGSVGLSSGSPADVPSLLQNLAVVPWEPLGRYYESDLAPGKHPYHEAGVYYIQDASAMAPAAFLMEDRTEGAPDPVEAPPLRVLDLCAAPGGKATQIACALSDRDLLFANEPVPSRAAILSENVERMGLRNTIVTSMLPDALAEHFPSFFDRILVDAPCSGEGMFRKNPEAVNEWSLENVAMCAARQAEILDAAANMLAPGGRLVYSTCTFSKEENEDTVTAFLSRHPELSLVNGADFHAFCDGMSPGIGLPETVRLFPHRVKGEGHFLAVFQKAGSVALRQSAPLSPVNSIPRKSVSRKNSDRSGSASPFLLFAAFAREALRDFAPDTSIFCEGQMTLFGDQLYLLPDNAPSLRGLKVLRSGLHLGTIKKNRLEPSHALALCLSPQEVLRSYDLSAADGSAAAWLRGETFRCDREKGWYLITVDGFSLGWGKLAGGTMKNHYPKGLRKP